MRHSVPMAVIEQLPEHLSDPVAVFQSATHPDESITVFIDAKDAGGDPVMLALRMDIQRDRARVNSIRSIYGKENMGAVASWIREGRTLYHHTKKSPELVRLLRVQFPASGSPIRGSEARVLTESDIVNAGEFDPPQFNRNAKARGQPEPKKSKQQKAQAWAERQSRESQAQEEIAKGDLAVALAGEERGRNEKVLRWVSDHRADLHKGVLGLIPRQVLADFAPPEMTAPADYVDQANSMDAPRHLLMAEYAALGDKWEKFARKNPKAHRELATLMYQSTIAGVDPSAEYVPLTTPAETQNRIRVEQEKARTAPGEAKHPFFKTIPQAKSLLAQEAHRKKAQPALKAKWSKLPAEAQEIYKEVRDTYQMHRQRVIAALQDRVQRSEASEGAKARLMDMMRLEFEGQSVTAPYFPLQRFGDYWAAVVDDDSGQTIEFRLYEKASQQLDFVKAMTGRGLQVVSGRKSQAQNTDGAVNAQFAAAVMDRVEGLNPAVADALKDDIWQLYLQRLPELSARKSFIHRKKIPGYDQDPLRAYAHNMFHGAHQLARLKWSDRLAATLERAERQDRDIKDAKRQNDAQVLVSELWDRHQWAMHPQGSALATHITGFGFAWFLGASVASAAVNLSQTPMIAYPVLGARYGFGKAAKALSGALPVLVRGVGGLEGAEKLAFQEFLESGVVDKTQAHDLAGVAEAGENYFTLQHKAMSAVSWLFHHAEKANREVTALAAYRLAKQSGIGHDAAVDYAKDAVWMSHYNYSNANRPRYLQNDIMKVVFLFKQYSLNTTYRMARDLNDALRHETPAVRREARRRFFGIQVMAGVMAGLGGLWMIKMVSGVVNSIVDDEDEPFDALFELRAFLAETWGPQAADVLMTGLVDGYTPLSMSDRVSLSDLWFRDLNRDLEGDEAFEHYLKEALGPIPSLVIDGLKGLCAIYEGEYARGAEKLMPSAIEGMMKAVRYMGEGVTTWKRDEVVPKEKLGAADYFAQAAGFTPSKVNRQYAQNTAIQYYESRILNRRQKLMNLYWLAWRTGDEETQQETLEAIQAYNRSNPRKAIKPPCPEAITEDTPAQLAAH